MTWKRGARKEAGHVQETAFQFSRSPATVYAAGYVAVLYRWRRLNVYLGKDQTTLRDYWTSIQRDAICEHCASHKSGHIGSFAATTTFAVL